MERVPNKSNGNPNDTREEVKLRHLNSCDADKDGTRQSGSGFHSQCLLPLLPHVVFQCSEYTGWFALAPSMSSIYFYLAGKGCDSQNHFLLIFLRKTTKGTEAFVFLSFVAPLTLLSLYSS